MLHLASAFEWFPTTVVRDIWPLIFSLLPSEKPLPENSPSRLVWTITFFVLVLAGVFAVLLLWPKTLPTQTWEFWTCVVVFPLGVSTLVVMRRFAHYEGHKLNIVLSNEAARGYNAHVFEVASRPLALVGAAYRFSVDPKEDAVESVRAGSVQLKTMAPLARDGEPTKARWLEVPGVNLHPGTKEHDRRRQRDVMKWLFAELINPLVAQVQTLPSGLDLRVHLLVSGEMTYTESEALWQECWREHSLRQVVVTEMTAPDDAEAIDVWLDHVSEGRRLEARLIVAIQLRRLLSAMPPAGGAEAGVALLLLPDVMASQYEVVRMANLHRPVRGPFDQSNNALLHALMWGRCCRRGYFLVVGRPLSMQRRRASCANRRSGLE